MWSDWINVRSSQYPYPGDMKCTKNVSRRLKKEKGYLAKV